MFTRDRLHGIKALFHPVSPIGIHVNVVAVAAQCFRRLGYLDAALIQHFNQGLQRRVKFSQ